MILASTIDAVTLAYFSKPTSRAFPFSLIMSTFTLISVAEIGANISTSRQPLMATAGVAEPQLG